MPVKKSGLGKGLDSLIPNKNVKKRKTFCKSGREKGSSERRNFRGRTDHGEDK